MSDVAAPTQLSAAETPVSRARGLSEPRVAFYIALGLIVAVLCAYAGIVRADFIIFDDNSHVFENPVVTAGLTWPGVVDAFVQPRASLWIPLTWISFMLDVSVFGLNPGAMHAVNLAWHTASTVLLFYTLRRMTGRLWASAFVAALFGVHPLSVESVAWITERKNVLCGFFWLASIAAYARYAERPRPRPYIFALVFAALAMLAKPMAVTLPCTLLLLDFWPLRRFEWAVVWRRVGEKLPFFALTILTSWMAIQGRRSEAVVSLETVTLGSRLSNALVSYAEYLGDFFWPVHLAAFYPHPIDPQPLLAGGALVLLAAVTVAAILVWKRHPYVLIGWLWFLGTIVPNIGVVQIGSQARADRFTYIALIGISMALAWLVADRWPKPPRWLGVAAGVVLLACSALTARQVGYWMNGTTLFEQTIAVTKNNACAYANAGLHRARDGEFEKAIPHYQASLRIQPDQAMIWRKFGVALIQLGKPQEAVGALRTGLQYAPTDFPARYQLGVALQESGATDEAIQTLQEILRDVPNSAGVHYHLALALGNKGRKEEGVEHLREAARLAPNDAKIAEALEKMNNR
jgi:protein O-mannosyl-transferase